MVEFPSEEWVKEFSRQLNENKRYEEAAKNWEGDFMLVVTPDEGLESEYLFYVDLWHGKCRCAYQLESREEIKTEFVYEGPYSNWKKLIRGEIDPIRGLLTGKFRLKGNMVKVVRATRAARELVANIIRVPTEFI